MAARAPATILIVDDNPANLSILELALRSNGHCPIVAADGEQALSSAARDRPDLILLDIMLPEMDGYEICERLKSQEATRDIPVIFVSALDQVRDKVRGFETGAADFITKPFQIPEVMARIETQLTIRALRDELKAQNAALARELAVAEELLDEARRRLEGPLLGQSGAVRRLREAIAVAGRGRNPVLLEGPGGAGEEAVARAIHFESDRRRQVFLTVQRATSEVQGDLFDRFDGPRGKLELARRGTLFIDGLHQLSERRQRRLLDFLENEPADDQPRIIATCPPELLGKVLPRLVRFFNDGVVRIPPLIERIDDLEDLVGYYVSSAAARLGRSVEGFRPEDFDRMREYDWPGNLRELEALIERSVLLSDSPILTIEEAFFESGRSVGGYALVRKIASGGMGEIWLARHRLLARPAAIKFILPRSGQDENKDLDSDLLIETRKRFRREARITASLECPHTVKLYDFGYSKDGRFYHVLELLKGIDVGKLIRSFGALPIERAIVLLRQACRSLAEAHAAGMVHRDIKPGNLFVAKVGLEYDFLKVLDFGIVRSPTQVDQPRLTKWNQVVAGTPASIAPEIALGKRDFDGRADIYSLGCVAFQMLTGERLFAIENPGAFLVAHITQAPRRPSRLRPELAGPLEELILACLEKDPDQRVASAQELYQRLGEVPVAEEWTQQRAEAWWKDNLPWIALYSDEDIATIPEAGTAQDSGEAPTVKLDFPESEG